MATGNCKIQFLCHIIVVGMRETRIPWAHVRPRDGLWTEQSINSGTGVFLFGVRFFVNALRFAPGSLSFTSIRFPGSVAHGHVSLIIASEYQYGFTSPSPLPDNGASLGSLLSRKNSHPASRVRLHPNRVFPRSAHWPAAVYRSAHR